MKLTQAKWVARIAALCLLVGGLAGCSTGGGPGLPALEVLAFNFGPGFGGVPLNANLILTFSAPVDIATVNSDSIRIVTVSTTTAQPDPGAPAVGTYEVNGEQVTFKPKVPQLADLSSSCASRPRCARTCSRTRGLASRCSRFPTLSTFLRDFARTE